MKLTPETVAGMIDHTNLKAFATENDWQKLCDEAKQYGFKSVMVNSYPVRQCWEMLKDTDILVGSVVGFPLGASTVEAKVFEARDAIRNGAREIDYVLNIGQVKMHHWAYIEEEMKRMTAAAHDCGAGCKVIFETCYLTEDEIIRCTQTAAEVKPDFVKTSTGFGTSGALFHHVSLMKKYVGEQVKVKAAGGIRSYADVQRMIQAGAERIGTSGGPSIIEEMKRNL